MSGRFSAYDDAIIKANWLTRSSDSIGASLNPPRDGSAIRVRARRLGLPAKAPGARNYGTNNGNYRHGRSRKGRKRGAIPADRIPLIAADFIRWRVENGYQAAISPIS